ncbi:hypothetical protein [Roseimaritima ulvae]|uniref:Class I SAM-dependent methyltransferase n=1 Tax=Roseimaritima ulvae TaxID=980254 RepID=A0A5B9QNK9_9BACT|nr:hypothetical protein [Roseimaritima ulvae]QEG39482.1 hypothetical protein UC8_14770 [Roseimaritima ulvae]
MSREQQIAWNRETLDGWELFREHRFRITELLTQLAPQPAGRLAVLGAGNCNDLDLSALCQAYAEIELLDWDHHAVVEGVRRQGLQSCEQLRIDAARDLSQSPDPAAIAAADCVASVGLLSQLMLSVTQVHDPGAPQQTIAAAAELRRQHFQHLLARMRPGAVGVVSFEIVSSDSLPELIGCANEAVPNLTAAAIGTGNFYTGLHPAAMFHTASQLAKDEHVSDPQMHRPWKWCLGPRTYAVAALSFRRPNSR